MKEIKGNHCVYFYGYRSVLSLHLLKTKRKSYKRPKEK